jgi:hypothetical protein
MENLLADIIDIQVIQSLMNDFYKLANMPIGINDLKGNVLVSAGWRISALNSIGFIHKLPSTA